MREGFRFAALLILASCFSPDYADGVVPCGAAGECPASLKCAVDQHCYGDGHGPADCNAGFERKNGACVDIDECQTGTDSCAAVAVCTNSAGSFTCACPSGYSGDGKSCTDLDECQLNTDGCATDATCANSAGSFSCTCNPGFSGPGTTCWPSYTVVAIGVDHACAVRTDGALYCWGSNALGQLGLGVQVTELFEPTRVGSDRWQTVSVGLRATCGVKSDGTLWCWGDDACGVVGDGGSDLYCDGVRAVGDPYPTGGATARWKTVAVGYRHACAVAMDGALWCWGQNGSGQLGTSDTANHLVPARVGMDVAADKNWQTVAPGGDHTCGLRDGQLWCWGDNSVGQIGDAQAEPQLGFPKRIGTSASWTKLGAGDAHTCGVVSDGALLCWGQGDRGQLGSGMSGDNEKRTAPTAVPSPNREEWVDVAAGGRSTCARLASGKLTCFGDNSYGGLGDGSFVDRARPVQVGVDSDWALVAVGLRNACGRKSDGRLLCWGRNLDGALGVGAGGGATTPRETGSGLGWTQLATGGGHACALRADRTLWCWGTNFDGELGMGVTGGARDAPTQVAGGGTWSSVAAGDGVTCAIRTDGDLYCWGYNFYGQLGIGTQGFDESKNAPTKVTSTAEGLWTRVSVRSAHTCALKDSGALYCWGLYSVGRLGLGPNVTANVVAPARVPGTWSAVTVGSAHTCGVQGGSMYCWGYNGSGQLGVGAMPPANDPALSPVRVGTATDWSQLVTGASHTCALRGVNSQLYCWGANFNGQVGNGSSGANANAWSPAAIAFGKSWVALTGGSETTCGVGSDGNLYCWGSNAYGLCANGMVGEKVVTPVMVDATRSWAQVGLMGQTGCAAHADGTIACWGDNVWGQFGDDTAFYEVPEAVAR